MKLLSHEEKVNALTNFLQTISTNKEFFIFSVNSGKNAKFSIATKTGIGGIDVKTKFFSYDEMNAYFYGVLSVKENKINF